MQMTLHFLRHLAQLLRNHIEHCDFTVGLRINRKKTEYKTFGDWSKIPQHSLNLSTGEVLSTLDFKYLGCWIKSTQQNLSVRIAMAWAAATRMRKV